MAEQTTEPKTIGKYQINGVLGRGAMGVVYKGYDPNIARPVAIKTIHKSLLATEMGQELLQRFRNEAQAVGRLTHSNVVSIFDFDIEEGMPFFVMELVEGRELKSLIKEGHRFSVEEIVDIIGQILDGLSYTHGLGIVHRDIKPANIFILNGSGTVKIADFGIARVDNSELTQVGSVLGTPSYMSPEQCTGSHVDARSDLFSVGVLMYELLTGRKAFKGDNSNTIMHNVVHGEPQNPSELNGELPKAFDPLVKKALAKKVDQRFQSAEEFKEALSMALQGKRIVAPGLFKRVMLSGGGAALVVALGVGSYWFIQSQPNRGQPVNHVENNTAPIAKPPIIAKTIDPADQEKIKRLLKVARAHTLVGRLVSPQGSCALDTYQLILEIDPYNEAAKKGLEDISNKLLERTQALLGEGKLEETKRQLDLALHLFPQHEGLMQLRLELEKRTNGT